jgi:chaperonin GroEL (HSP60 family)
VRKVVQLKRKVRKEGEGFVVINQRHIDPLSLDSFAKEDILDMRTAKKRSMERLALACGMGCIFVCTMFLFFLTPCFFFFFLLLAFASGGV